jgi:lantibiotic modifying enzyme
MNDFREQASSIARRICRDAIWSDGSCNWIGPSMDSWNMWDVRQKSFGPDLYSGTSGVALFLGAVAQTDDELLIRKTSLGAAHHAWKHAANLGSVLHAAVYSGTLGIAWALIQVGELLHEPTWQDRALVLLDCLHTDVEYPGTDVMSGYAGAIPLLLKLAHRYDRLAWVELAVRWGDQLERKAVRSEEGWSWRTLELPPQIEQKNLTGFSHGTAGIGWALLELFAVTRETRFKTAADEAFRYERTHYSAEAENWPDFREFLRPAGSSTTFGKAWCHGAPGIALSRLRAWRLTGNPQAREEAETALRTTKRTLQAPAAFESGFSLCHGCAGNADVLLEADRLLTAPDLRKLAEQVGQVGIEQFELPRLPWPCGLPGAGESANLMLGTAGIGYFYLRLADPAVPSVLMIG